MLLFTLMKKLLLSNQIICPNICLYVLDIPEGGHNNQNSQETAVLLKPLCTRVRSLSTGKSKEINEKKKKKEKKDERIQK